MKATIIENANGVMLGDPDNNVFDLHVRQQRDPDGVLTRWSAWVPTPNELADLAGGATVHVGVLGETFPPIDVQVGRPPSDEPVPVDDDGAIASLVRHLRSHAVAEPGCGQAVIAVGVQGQISTRYQDVRMTGLHLMFAIDIMLRTALERLPPDDKAEVGSRLAAARAALGMEGFWNDEKRS